MRTLLVILAAATLLAAGPARGHDFYHDECWDDGCRHSMRCYVTPSKLDMAWGLYEKGRWQANEHMIDRAIPTLKEAIELCPKIGKFHLTLGLVLRDSGKKDEAVAELRLARQYGVGCVEEEAYWALKDLGEDPNQPAAAKDESGQPEVAAPPVAGDVAGDGAPVPPPVPAKAGPPKIGTTPPAPPSPGK